MKKIVLMIGLLLAVTSAAWAAPKPQQQASANLSITVVAPLQITTTSLPSGLQGSVYSAQLAAAGGTLPYSWSCTVAQGQTGLPPNLSCSVSGLISGTIAQTDGTQPYSFTVSVQDSGAPRLKTSMKIGER